MPVPPLLPLLAGSFCPSDSFLGCAEPVHSPWTYRESSFLCHCWGWGTRPLLSLFWAPLPSAGVFFTVTHKHPLPGTFLPEGSVGHGAQRFPPQPQLLQEETKGRFLQERASRVFMSVAEAHDKITSEGHPYPPRSLSEILKMKEFLVAPNHHSVSAALSKRHSGTVSAAHRI